MSVFWPIISSLLGLHSVCELWVFMAYLKIYGWSLNEQGDKHVIKET